MIINVLLYFQNEVYSNNVFPQERVVQDPYSPAIRILINTNDRRSSPFITLRRRTNTNFKLRISTDVMNNNGPLRIAYRPSSFVSSESKGRFNSFSRNIRNAKNNFLQPFYRTLGRSNIQISTRGLNSMRIRS